MGYDLPRCYCVGYIGNKASCYSIERGTALTPCSIWSILQHLLPAFEFAGSSALDQVGLMNLDPLLRLNGRAMEICMIVLTDETRLIKPKNSRQSMTSSKLMMRYRSL